MDNCVKCGLLLDGGILTLSWEDGDNRYAYVTCPHCGYENYMYGSCETES